MNILNQVTEAIESLTTPTLHLNEYVEGWDDPDYLPEFGDNWESRKEQLEYYNSTDDEDED